MRSALRRSAALLLALVLLATVPLRCQQIKATEYEVKAAFLFNFAKYVTWPRPPDETFSICVLGRDPFGTSLENIVAGEKIGGKPASARRIQSVQEASACQVLFLSESEEPKLQPTLAALSKVPVLTVSDMPRFAEHGGMIQFVSEGNRVRFVVNLDAAQRAGLTLSSELLKVAKSVQRDLTAGRM